MGRQQSIDNNQTSMALCQNCMFESIEKTTSTMNFDAYLKVAMYITCLCHSGQNVVKLGKSL